jgi:hypothetical protein
MGQLPDKVMYAPPIGKNTAIIKNHIAKIIPKILNPPPAFLEK